MGALYLDKLEPLRTSHGVLRHANDDHRRVRFRRLPSLRTLSRGGTHRRRRRLNRLQDHQGALANIEHLRSEPRFSFIHHNISQHLEIDGPLDNVLHFASPASPVDYLNFPIQTLKVGSLGTLNSLGVAKAKGAAYLLASTSEVYGDPIVHPQTEEYWGNVNPIGIRGVYDEDEQLRRGDDHGGYHRAPPG